MSRANRQHSSDSGDEKYVPRLNCSVNDKRKTVDKNSDNAEYKKRKIGTVGRWAEQREMTKLDPQGWGGVPGFLGPGLGGNAMVRWAERRGEEGGRGPDNGLDRTWHKGRGEGDT